MSTSKIVVRWSEGLHLRVAARLVKIARKYRSAVRLRAGGHVANAENVMQLLLLSAGVDTVLIIEADGADEVEAVKAVAALFANPEGSDPMEEGGVTHRPPRTLDRYQTWS